MGHFSLILVITVLIALLLLGSPVIFAIGAAALTYFVSSPDNWMFVGVYAQKFFDGINAFVWLSIPLFVLAGEIMSKTGLTERLLTFCRLLVGRFRGGLAYVNVLGSMLFGGVSGSGLADVSALGPIEIDMMKRDGYRTDFATAVTVTSSIQGPIIPPSIPLIVFSSLTGTSVGALFLAGAIPGVLLGLSLMLVIWVLGRRHGFPANPLSDLTLRGVAAVVVSSLGALMMPLIVVGGIVAGVFTATEAAAVAAAYAMFLGLVGYRNLSLPVFWGILDRTMRTTASIYLIIAFVTVISWILAMEQVPMMIETFVERSNMSPWMFLLLLNLFLLLNGLWLSDIVQLVLFAPIFTPIAMGLCVDPVQFGVIMVMNIMLSMITPPYGLALYLGAAISGATLGSIVRQSLPFLGASLVVLLLITYIPPLTLWLPGVFGFVK